MSDLGYFALVLGLFLSGYAILIDLLGSWRADAGLVRSARNATVACFGCLSVAMLALWVLLVKSEFAVAYVAEHTSKALPLPYKISALWAGAAGSLLLWLWVQVGFVVWAYCKAEFKHRNFCASARAFANLVNIFFLIILITDGNPFELSSVVPADGAGLNPLLQHPAMVFHPPILFIGYAGFLVPFAWAVAWLRTNPADGRAPLSKQARHWTLVAWLFLTGGIALGAWWAYEELGWGGYWAWDPVENASLMPWLTATALLHCFRTYKPRSSTATWTIVLSSVTFSLCVFGRFLTKYGLVDSVHAFSDPGLGILYVVLLLHLWFVVAALLIRNHIRNKKDTSRDPAKANAFVLLNNWLFVLLTFVIFVGTLFPFLSKVFIRVATFLFSNARLPANPISLAPAFFTRITAPGGLFILMLLGLCPYLLGHGLRKSWRTILSGAAVVVSVTVWLLTCSLPPGDVSGGIGSAGRWLLSGSPAIPCFIFCGLILVNLIADFLRYEKKIASGRKAGLTSPRSLRWYGARVVHLGVAMVFIGIAGSGGYASEKMAALRPGEKVRIGKYELTLEKLGAEHGPNFTTVSAYISVHNGDKLIASLKPAIASYSPGGKTVREIDVRRTLAGDLYLAMTEFDRTQNLINLQILIKPLINWIWIGSFVMVFGTLGVLLSPYRRKTTAVEDQGKDRQ